MLHSTRLLPLFALLVALNFAALAQTKPASISLTVVGQKDSVVTLSTTDLISMDTLLLDSKRLNSDGKVALNADLKHSIFATVFFGKTYVLLLMEPGMSFNIRFDEKNEKEKLTITGDGADAARVLADYEKVRVKYDRMDGKYSLYAEEADFVKRGIGLQKELNAIYEPLITNKNIAQHTLHLLDQYREQTIRFFYINYAHFKYDGTTDPAMPASIKEIVSKKFVADTAALFSNMYPYGTVLDRELIFQIHEKVGKMMGKPPYDSTSTLEIIEITDRQIAKMDYATDLKGFFRMKNLAYWVHSDGTTPAMQSVRNELVKDPSQKRYLKAINKSFSVWDDLQPGKPAPNFTGITPEGKSISLSDLKGKLVYIDVWATWCQPCVGEFPDSKKLLEEFKGNDNIVFLFVSVDENLEKWKKMLSEERMPKGVQIQQAQNNQADDISQNYRLSGIPRYILIAKDGTMLQTHAPRPSSGKVAALLRKYI